MALTELEIAGIVLLSMVLVVVVFLILLKIYARLSCGVCKSTAKMNGKTVIITGANSGIGLETARDLAKRGAKVILACRNLSKAEEAKDSIIKSTGNNQVLIRQLDLSSFQSIREFAKTINKTESKIDVLIHNAGLAYTFQKVVTKDGLDMTMGTNHFGPFLLTHLLIDLLKKSSPARIVIVASELYRFACFNINKLNPVNFWLPAYYYYVSKYANIVFCLELAKRLNGTGITVNCLHPGMIDSGIWKNVPWPLNWFLIPLIKGLFKSPEEGAQTSIYCAVSDDLEGVTGKYFLDCKESSLSTGIKDAELGKQLWELSKDLVKLQTSDPII